MSDPELLVLDTGPLLSFLTILLQDALLAESGEALFDDLIFPTNYRYKAGDQRRRDGLVRFVQTKKGLLYTSSGVVAEMHRRVRSKMRGPHPKSFWALARRQFDELDIREENVALRHLDETLLPLLGLGPVDTGLLELASSMKKGGKLVTVVTIDSELQEQGAKRGLDVRHIDNLVGLSAG